MDYINYSSVHSNGSFLSGQVNSTFKISWLLQSVVIWTDTLQVYKYSRFEEFLLIQNNYVREINTNTFKLNFLKWLFLQYSSEDFFVRLSLLEIRSGRIFEEDQRLKCVSTYPIYSCLQSNISELTSEVIDFLVENMALSNILWATFLLID